MRDGQFIIETQNLTKKYNGLTAVDRLNLKIEKGEIFGLLGPNGAGKTTTILMLLGLTEPTEGKAWIAGHDATREPILVKRIVGYLPDNVGFYQDMTGRENLRYVAQLNGLSRQETEKRIDALLERVRLVEAGDKKVGTYSRGMRQRLGIADMLMKDPQIIILDEPTLGLDPEGIQEMLDLITELSRKDGRTVLISSHLLYQVQKICDRVGIFVKGKLLASGPIASLGEQVFENQPQVLEVKIDPENETLLQLIKGMDSVESIKHHGGMITISSKVDIRKQLVSLLNQHNFTLLHMRLRGRELDDIYRRYFAKEGVS
ncbi:MAG: type transport system ATP-binding protein [Clostridiales bacterium]|jgi:ABC-2 type transport system ATP-binding protein|nr:type transport system ATP-binding protein [Clostridiales bacterium]MDK2933299.1 type transport system ATP-binding protein [Clostridiales bacterium]